MKGRERVLRAITMTGPDRAPIDHYIMPGAFYRHGEALHRIVQQYPDDFGSRGVHVPEAREADVSLQVSEWRDVWGNLRRGLLGYTNGEVIEPAIPTWDAWQEYRFPPLPGREHWDQRKRDFQTLGEERIHLSGGGQLFQLMQSLRGVSELLMDLAEDCPGVHELADAIVDYHLHSIKEGLAAGADCITFGDDWGAQDRLLIRPAQWRSFFKARYKRMFDVIHDAGALVWFPSDGWIPEIIPDLIEIGVNVLNPQHGIIGDERVAALTAGKACIRTDIDRQWLIPHGAPEEIREYVKKILKLFGDQNGGIILHGEVGPDVPLENIRAMYSAFYDYGKYPFGWL